MGGGIDQIGSTIGAVTGIGGALGGPVNNIWGDVTGSNQTKKAIEAQRDAAAQSNATLTYMYEDQKRQMEPWRESGIKALTGLEDPNFGKNLEMDPGYQFRLSEGLKAVNASAGARGMGNSGATMKALTRYGQDYASNEYDKVYNRQFNRLSTLAGYGNNTMQTGVQAAGNYGGQLSANQLGLGNALASANIAQSNRNAQLIGNGMSLGGMIAMSDERLKTEIEEISAEDLAEMRSHLKAYKFRYKNKDHGAGDWIGVMAQDLEKSKLGRTFVFEDENGHKQLHIPRLLSFFLATQAEG